MSQQPSNIGFNPSGIVNITNQDGLKMLDKLSRLADGRRRRPLEQTQNIFYNHRYYYDEFNLLIGDCYFVVPPEFILVSSASSVQNIVTLRQENTQKMKAGYHNRTIMIDLVFNGLENINGYPVDSPEGTYYVDGLRQLLAQFKCTPFLPITNPLLNGVYGIFTVSLQSITISVMEGYPDTMVAQITLQEMNMTPYLEMPDVMFKYMIDWDLFRFYYQRFLTETHEYKKLQSLPKNKNHNRFKMSVLNPNIISDSKFTQYDMLQILKDPNNYTTYVDSNEKDVAITGFHCGYSNMLTNIQLADCPSPTTQFIGGMDTVYSINFETTDIEVVQCMEQCQITNDNFTRNNQKLRSVGFVKLESELVAFTGSLFVMIENVQTNTVPGFPGLYNVQIQCVSFDIAQSEREDLHGFLPFDCGTCDSNNAAGKDPTCIHKEQAINQSPEGLKIKTKQDNYAEWKIRTTMEVYPDMKLPTYAEVDAVISKIIAFRNKNKLPQISYTKYPRQPTNILHGNHPNNNISFTLNGSFIDPTSINTSSLEYDIYVDPDFYVFYPESYESFLSENEKYYDDYSPVQRTSYTKTKTITREPDYTPDPVGDDSYAGTGQIADFVNLARSFVGHSYVWGAYGNKSDSKGLVFDCSGLVSYCMSKTGLAPAGFRVTTATIPTSTKYFKEVPFSDRQYGDVLLRRSNGSGHVVIYEGNDKIVHAWCSKYGVVENSLSKNCPTINRCFRITTAKSSGNSGGGTPLGGSSSNNYGVTVTQDFLDLIKTWEGFMGNAGYKDGGIDIGYGFHNQYWDGTKYVQIKMGMTMTRAQADKILKAKIEKMIPQTISKLQKNGWNPADFTNNQILALTSYFYNRGYYNSNADALLNKSNSPTIQDIGNNLPNYWGKKVQAKTGLKNRREKEKAFFFKGGSGKVANPANCLTQDEFDAICRAVMGEARAEGKDTMKGIAQVIYDRLNDSKKKWGGLSNILTSEAQFQSYTGAISQDAKDVVTDVFCNNKKKWPTDTVQYFLTANDNLASFKDRDKKYDRIGDLGKHTFWGKKKKKGSNKKYTIVPNSIANGSGAGAASQNTFTYTVSTAHNAVKVSAKNFGMPVWVVSENLWYTGIATNNAKKKIAQKQLNSTENIFCSSFCDEVQYSGRAKLVRAFPTYLFCILDDQAQWYDGRKLWTNFYVHRSVVDIAVHGTNDMPTETATLTVTNNYYNLSRTQGGLGSYSIKNDSSYAGIVTWFYKNTGMLIGGIKLTDKLIQLHQEIYQHAMLREGARIHLRIGYGSDPLSLAPVMNGHISDVSLGDQISIVVTSDGGEFVQHIVSSKEKDTNNGFIGLFGLGEDQESSNIIAKTLCARSSWANHLFKKWFEGSKYSIEHYGLYWHQGLDDIGLSDLWDGCQEQYDLCKNIYKANYKVEHYIYCSALGFDKEENVVFSKYNMTPWDMFQVCTQQVPEYIVKSTYHQFDSRLYFGIPGWMEKFRYDWLNGKLYEECKTAAQVHFIDSLTDIIDNQVRVTSKFSNTNVKVMYTRGKSNASTKTIHSDDSIDFSKQKTTILDTPITQDALGPDLIYEFLGYDVGKESARRVGISHLLYGWQQQYQGQIICIGNPGIKPHDYLMVNDTFGNLYGICIAREVTHMFNTSMGYVTMITPGMIGYSTDENSGMIEVINNYIMLLNCFSNYLNARKELRNNYEQNLSVIADLELIKSRFEAAVGASVKANNRKSTIGGIASVSTFGVTIGSTVKVCRALRDTHKATGIFRNIAKGVSAGWKAGKGVGKVLSGIKAGSIAAGGCVGGVGAIVVAAIWVLVDILIQDILDWFSNKNVCCLFPMWWEGYPFVAGVKDGEKILLQGQNANATKENDKSDGTGTGEENIWASIEDN